MEADDKLFVKRWFSAAIDSKVIQSRDVYGLVKALFLLTK